MSTPGSVFRLLSREPLLSAVLLIAVGLRAGALAVVLVGATVMGLVGFGLGMVISPALLPILEPQTVVITINSLSIPILALVLYQTRTSVNVRSVTPLAIGGVVAVPLGVLILSSASPTILRITIGAIILLLAIPIGLNIQRPLPGFSVVSPAFGFLGSMLVTGLGVGAPLVVLFLVNQRWPAHAIRPSISTVLPVARYLCHGPI